MIPLVKVKLVKPTDEGDICVGCYFERNIEGACPTDGDAKLLCSGSEIDQWAIWQEYDIPTKLKEIILGRRRYKQVNAKEGCRECYFYNGRTMKCHAVDFNYKEITNDCTNNGKIWKHVIVLKAQENKV